jgi:hypothetical protein
VGQSQSRLDKQFPFVPSSTGLLGTMRLLMAVLEARFQRVEEEQATAEEQADTLVDVGLARINEVLLPLVVRIQKLTSLGFLVARSGSSVKLELAQKTFILTEGEQRDLFTPSAYVAIERVADFTTRAIAQVLSYDNTTGFLTVVIVAAFGSATPHDDWVITSSPGVSEATRQNMDNAAASAAAALASRVQTDADAAATAADRAAVHADRLAADLAAAAAYASQMAIDPVALLKKAKQQTIKLQLAL